MRLRHQSLSNVSIWLSTQASLDEPTRTTPVAITKNHGNIKSGLETMFNSRQVMNHRVTGHTEEGSGNGINGSRKVERNSKILLHPWLVEEAGLVKRRKGGDVELSDVEGVSLHDG